MCQPITKRIKLIIENEKLSLTSFSHKTGIARTTLQSMFEKGTNPSFDLLTKVIDAFPSYSIGWIFTGKGEILIPQQSELQIDFPSEPKTKSTPTQSSLIDYKEKYIELLEETNALYKENLTLRAENERLRANYNTGVREQKEEGRSAS